MFSRVPNVREQGGFALPTVMMMSIAAFSIASVALLSSISSQGNTIHDQRSKTSFATAESGISDAMLRYNLTAATAATPCAPLPVSGSIDGNGWCPPVTISPAVNGGSVQYWVHPPSLTSPSRRCQGTTLSTACMEVVAFGTLNGVSRRVDVTATNSSGTPVFGDAAVKAIDSISLDSNAEIHSGVATNGPMSLSSNAKQCGAVSVGVGQALTLSANAQYNTDVNCTQQATTYAQAPLALPPVNQGDAPSNNDNGRFFGLDVVSGNKSDACFNGRDANGAVAGCGARELSVGGNSALTLGGGVYSLCKLSLTSNSKLYTATGAQVEIYFDSPEACGYSSGTAQMTLSSNTRISTPNIAPSSVALLFVGSLSRATSIQLNSNTDGNALCQQNFVIYAPLTSINMNSNSQYCGALGAKALHLDSHAVVTTGSGTSNFTLPGTAAYYTLDGAGFVECAAASASPPNTGC